MLSLIAVALALATIALGTYVRSSDAGLGCPEWPGCFDRTLTPWDLMLPSFRGGSVRIDVAGLQADLTTHRYFAGAVGICILTLSALVWTLKRNRMWSAFLSLASMTMLILQALLGMWAQAHRLLPIAVAGHLLLGFAMLVLLYLLYLVSAADVPETPSVETGTRVMAWLGLLLVVSQTAAGGWASANHAGLACPEFPGCLGQAWPDADFHGGFSPWRMLRAESAESVLSWHSRAAIHWVHRLGGLATYLLLTLLAILLSLHRSSAKLRRLGVGLAVMALAQAGFGVALVLMRMPVLLGTVHSLMTGALLLLMVYLCHLITPGGQRLERV